MSNRATNRRDVSIYHYDGNGNVAVITNQEKEILDRFEYDSFGQILTGGAFLDNRFGFSTKFGDRETRLVYYGYRYYDPSAGRWLSKDPIAENGGLNLYGFLNNNAVDAHDILGFADNIIIIRLWCNDEWSPDISTWVQGKVYSMFSSCVSKCKCAKNVSLAFTSYPDGSTAPSGKSQTGETVFMNITLTISEPSSTGNMFFGNLGYGTEGNADIYVNRIRNYSETLEIGYEDALATVIAHEAIWHGFGNSGHPGGAQGFIDSENGEVNGTYSPDACNEICSDLENNL